MKYIQIDGLAMSLPLELVLAHIFIIEPENSLLPNLTKRYVEGTICFEKKGITEFIIPVLISIHFTFGEENDETIPFLDILFNRKRNDITTTVYRKSTCIDIYLNWNAFAPATWKTGTLKTLAIRAYVICSTDQLLERELKYLEKIFHGKSNYSKFVITQILDKALKNTVTKMPFILF